MKRSQYIQLVLIGSSLVFLSACDQKPEESKENKSIDSILADTARSQVYMNKEECEKIHGEGKCSVQPHESGRGSVFMPMIAGYMLGSMFNKPTTSPHPDANSQQKPTQRGGFGGQAKRYFSAGG